MKTTTACCVLIIACLMAAAAAGAAQPARYQTTFGRFTIEAKHFEGSFQDQGPWEWSGQVKVTSADLTMTCDRFKAWFTKDRRNWERVEAAGHIVITGRYVAADKTIWQVTGKADSAAFDAKSGLGMLKGAVDFKARNTTTGAAISAKADQLTYDTKTRRFKFERGKRPVRVEWQQPEPAPAEKSAQPAGGENEGGK